MSEIHVIARHRIKPGKLDEFERIGKLARQETRENEPDTLAYRWYLNANSETFVVMQRYPNLAAFMHHIANFKHVFYALEDICETRVELFGHVPDETRDDLAQYGIVVFAPFGEENA